MTRWPWPSSAALLAPDVYICRSALLTLSPVSICHLLGSTAHPAEPSNVSWNVTAAAVTSSAAAGPACAGAMAAEATRTADRVAKRHLRSRRGETTTLPSVRDPGRGAGRLRWGVHALPLDLRSEVRGCQGPGPDH